MWDVYKERQNSTKRWKNYYNEKQNDHKFWVSCTYVGRVVSFYISVPRGPLSHNPSMHIGKHRAQHICFGNTDHEASNISNSKQVKIRVEGILILSKNKLTSLQLDTMFALSATKSADFTHHRTPLHKTLFDVLEALSGKTLNDKNK